MAENNSSAPLKTAPVSLAEHRANRIYVAGPMTGLPDFNFPAFNAAANELRVEGWHVENPAEHGIVDGAQWSDYMHTDLQQLSTCCAIYLLPGWSKSRGATLEAHVAQALGMAVYYAPNAETQAVAAQAAPAAVAVPGERAAYEDWARAEDINLASDEDGYVDKLAERTSAAWQARAALAATPALPATEDSSAGDLADGDFWPVDKNASRKQLIAQIGQMNFRLTALRQENAGLIKRAKAQAKVQAEPVAYLVLRSSFRASPDGQDAEGHEWLEEAGCDTPGAFPVYTAPQAQPADALDAARLLFLMDDIDGFVIVEKDKYDFAIECAGEAGREEPTEADELNGLRRLLDAAMAAAQEGGNAAKEV